MSTTESNGVTAATLQAVNAAFAEAATGLRAALTASQAEATRLEGDVNRLQTELELQQSAAIATASASQSRIRQLQIEVEALNAQLAAQSEGLLESVGQQHDLQVRLDDAMASAQRLEAQHEALKGLNEELAAEHRLALSQLQDETAALQDRLQAENAARIGLELELSTLRERTREQLALQQQTEALRKDQDRQLDELNSVLAALRLSETSLRESLLRQEEAARAAEATAATLERAQMAQIDRLQEELAAAREETEAQRRQLKQSQEALDLASARIDDLHARQQTLERAHAAAMEEARYRAIADAEAAQRRVQDHQREIAHWRVQHEQAIAEQQRQHIEAQAQLHEAQSQIQWLGGTAERLQARIEEAQAREQSLVEQWQALRAEAASLRHRLQSTSSVASSPMVPLLKAHTADTAIAPAQPGNTLPAAGSTARESAPSKSVHPKASVMTEESPEIQHVNQLLALRDVRFVRSAYRSILGREPDDAGLAFHLERVRTARDKVAVVYHLATSAEGAKRPQQLAGLRELLAEQRPRQGRMARWLQRMAMSFSTVRRVEVALDSVAEDITARLDAVAGHLDAMDRRLDGFGRQLADSTDGTRQQIQRLTEQLDRQCGALVPMLATCQESSAASEQRLAAMPALLDQRLEALLQAQRDFLAQAMRPSPQAASETSLAPQVEMAARPSATELQLDAAPGATPLLRQLAKELAASSQAAVLARTPRD